MKHKKLILLSLAAIFVGGLRENLCTANSESLTGRHNTACTKLANGAFASRHLLVVLVTDADHVTPCSASTRPYGLCDDQADAAGDVVNVQYLGGNRTVRMVATAAIAEDLDVYTAANGQVQALPNASVTVWRVGVTKRASSVASDGNNYVEVLPQTPEQVVVTAGSGSGSAALGAG